MTPLELRLVGNYTTLVMAKVKTLEDVPEKYREAVSVEIAKRELEVLEKMITES